MSDVAVTLRWTGEGLRFEGEVDGGASLVVDGGGKEAPSPMQSLLAALAGCMGIDVVEILRKMRVPLESLEVRVEGDRAPEPPRRYTRIGLVYRVRGVEAEHEDRVWRAIELSREKYCSVLHTLRPDVEVGIEAVLD